MKIGERKHEGPELCLLGAALQDIVVELPVSALQVGLHTSIARLETLQQLSIYLRFLYMLCELIFKWNCLLSYISKIMILRYVIHSIYSSISIFIK